MGDITYRHINMDRGEWPQGREEGKPKGQGENSARRKNHEQSVVQHMRSLGKLARRILEGWVLKRQNCG